MKMVTRKRVGRLVLYETDHAIMNALVSGRGLLTSEIAREIGRTLRATRTRLARLVGSGLLREVGSGPQDPKRRYFRAEREKALTHRTSAARDTRQTQPVRSRQ